MKALLLTEAGTDFKLRLSEVATPEPGPGEVRLRVRASSLNPVDYKFARSGTGLSLPHVLGIDAAGEIDALGPGVTGWAIGERVMALCNLYRWGGFAEHVVVDLQVLSRLPDNLSFEQAATLPCAGLTAWQALLQKFILRPGQTVLITAAGGGVGGFAVQLAKQVPGVRVLATSSRSAARVSSLGADAVVDYRQVNVVDAVMDLTQGRGVDAIIDLVSAESATQLIPLLRHNGHIVCVVGRPSDATLPPWGKAISIHDVALGFAYQYGDASDLASIAKAGETLAAWVADGLIKPQIQEVIALESVPTTLRLLGQGSTQGKVVVRL